MGTFPFFFDADLSCDPFPSSRVDGLLCLVGWNVRGQDGLISVIPRYALFSSFPRLSSSHLSPFFQVGKIMHAFPLQATPQLVVDTPPQLLWGSSSQGRIPFAGAITPLFVYFWIGFICKAFSFLLVYLHQYRPFLFVCNSFLKTSSLESF